MQQPETPQTTQQTVPETLDQAAIYVRRRRTALLVTVSLMALALLALTVGLISSTRTDNVPVAGCYPGITLSFGAFLGIVGIHLVENRRPMLVAAIVFISIGVIASFFCAIVDGIIASEFIEIKPVMDDRCEYYESGSGYAYDNNHYEKTCRAFNRQCSVQVQSYTCFCCDVYNCGSSPIFYEFTGVSSCWDVVHLYRLIWASVVLNVILFFLGIITAAILGAFKDLQKSNPAITPSPAPPPHILYNPHQHMGTYPSFSPPRQALHTFPNYTIPMQHINNFQTPATTHMMPEVGSSSFPSDDNQTQQPSQVPTQRPQGTTQDQEGSMQTPNAPVMYVATYNPFEKPPPYAY